MEKIKFDFLKTWNLIIIGILSLLGFTSSCDKETLVAYGTPSAKFIINGTVTDETTQTPIKNIRVVMVNESEYSYIHDTTYTDSDGNYELIDEESFPTDQTYTMYFQDIDEDTNGSYAEVDSVATFTDPTFTDGDGNWYSGETSKELNIKMTPEE